MRVEHGDCRDVVRTLADGSVDSCVTDPPYSLVSIQKRFGNVGRTESTMPKAGPYARASAGFMGQRWDTGETAFDPAWWAEVLRVLKPGAHLIAFGGTRTYHRLACAIEDAGFEIRDQLAWAYASGFPKSHDVSKAIDKAAGAERQIVGERKKLQSYGANEIYGNGPEKDGVQLITSPATEAAARWEGWGTALKPAWEPIVLARKPLAGTVAANVLEHGTGALNIDGCRIPTAEAEPNARDAKQGDRSPGYEGGFGAAERAWTGAAGRWPANLVHDGSDEVMAEFARYGERTSGKLQTHHKRSGGTKIGTFEIRERTGEPCDWGGDTGSAARFFFSAKAGADDRCDSKHPTVKPVALMRWLCRLVTPPGGLVLDPFAGSGTSGVACIREGFDALLIEREAQYVADINRRLARLSGGDTPLFGSAAE